jgi:DNA helicase-2/ATP-dependent DNA helicase PcrA
MVHQSILKDLDEDQREAVTTTEGPLLVVAGPGSGKTRVITYRFAYIVLSGKSSVDEILCVTFTNKAAEEMRSRILSLVGDVNVGTWWIKTFHSFGLSIIRENYELFGLGANFVVYDSDDQVKLIKELLKEYNLGLYSPELLADYISLLDRTLRFEEAGLKEEVIEFYKIYKKALRDNNAVDFGDLVRLPYEELLKNERLRKFYKSRWKYIMIDEFQDTDKVQYEFIKLILNDSRNICVVGDDDQSIYGWRGASVENIRNFDRDFKDCKVVILRTNYRSTEEIIRLSNFVAQDMLFRRDGKLIKGTGIRGTSPVIIEAQYQDGEAYTVASIIRELVQRGEYSYKDIAVLYRVNYLSRVLEEKLIRMNIPYVVYSGVGFFERIEVKDILAYLKFSINPYDFVSFARIINVPRRGIGEATLKKILDKASNYGMDYFLTVKEMLNKGELPKAANEFVKAIEILKNDSVSLSERVEKMIDEINYYDYLETLEGDYYDRVENVEELIRTIADFERNGKYTDVVIDFLNNAVLKRDSDNIGDNGDHVSIMSLHVSKGLEFPVVFIFGVVDGIIPHVRNIHKANLLDEERRLFYVGITRAKRKLFLSYHRYRIGKFGEKEFCNISRFLKGVKDIGVQII